MSYLIVLYQGLKWDNNKSTSEMFAPLFCLDLKMVRKYTLEVATKIDVSI